MTQLFWFRELVAGGKGPDWLFNASFTPSSSGTLAEVVREHTPTDFTYYRATQRPCPIDWNSKACDYDLYVDTPHYRACIDQLEGRQEHNLYIYHTIQVCQHQYQLVRGYGGGSDQHGSAETHAIRALAETPMLIMTKWNIVYGGGTYSYDMLVSGATSTALLAYLDAKE